LLKLVDLSAIAEIGRRGGVWIAADDTFASPWAQRPLDHRFSVVVHSTAKYLNGHSDVTGGIAIVGDDHDPSDNPSTT
jgi:cystathionine gamma-lyase